jgi:acetylornithine/succinyldiaminopimelate/putrescine aminotransferase
MNLRQLFLEHLAQTSDAPLALEIKKAKGSLLWDAKGKKYIDLIAGISVCNVGHCHPKVLSAIKKQTDQYLHAMVYGELIESPQVRYAKWLTDHLPATLNTVYFTNSGAEAVEGAMKLAKRFTERTKIIAFEKGYHGSTQGALSIIGDENWRRAYRPLLPMIEHAEYNSASALEMIDENTACVIAETIQGEAGIVAPSKEWMQLLRKKCSEKGCLLILDEIQSGFGRTGKLWGFEHFDFVPDILLLGKALGGGMPLGAFIADKKIMNVLTEGPPLGHITTFGGHPVCCAAGKAAMEVLLKEISMKEVKEREQLLLDHLVHPSIKSIRSFGLWLAVEFDSFEKCKEVVDQCIEYGVLTDWFLFAPNCMRICPPLNINKHQVGQVSNIILASC